MTKRIAATIVSCFAAVALLAGPAAAAESKGKCANNGASNSSNAPVFCL